MMRRGKFFTSLFFYVLVGCLVIVVFGGFFSLGYDGQPHPPPYEKLWSEISSTAKIISYEGQSFFSAVNKAIDLDKEIKVHFDQHTFNPFTDSTLGPWYVEGEFYEKNLLNGIWLTLKYFGDYFALAWFSLFDFFKLIGYFLQIIGNFLSLILSTIFELFELPFRLF